MVSKAARVTLRIFGFLSCKYLQSVESRGVYGRAKAQSRQSLRFHADRTLGRGPSDGYFDAAAAISFNMGGDQRGMQAFGLRMAQRIELARDRAIQNNQEWGMRVTEEEYVFVVFDEMQQRWIPQLQAPFKPDEPPQPVLYDLSAQGKGATSDHQIICPASGTRPERTERVSPRGIAGCGVLLQR